MRLLSKAQHSFHVHHDAEHLAASLANELAQLIRATVANRGVCHMVFPGGGSPRRTLELLSKQDLPWVSLHLYPSDERCVPADDDYRNDRLIEELVIKRGMLPPENLHRIPAELGPEEGALQYSQLLDHLPQFDIALLGMGSDGHTASLFPKHPGLTDQRSVIPVCNAPKPPPERVSIGLHRLLTAHNRWVMAMGGDKQDALDSAYRGDDLPVTQVKPTAFFVDLAAAGSFYKTNKMKEGVT